MPAQVAAAKSVVQDFPKAPRRRRSRAVDPQAEAMLALAAELKAVNITLGNAVETLKPAIETVHGFGDRLDALCQFLKKKGPWLLGSAPGVLLAVQAISPSAAKALQAALHVAGVQ